MYCIRTSSCVLISAGIAFIGDEAEMNAAGRLSVASLLRIHGVLGFLAPYDEVLRPCVTSKFLEII